MSGYLHKKSPKNGKYKKMWFVLKEKVLYVFKASADTVANDTFPILGYDLKLEKEVLQIYIFVTNFYCPVSS